VEAAIGALGQQVEQLAQFVAPGGGLPEQGEGIGQGAPALAGAAQLGGGAQAIGIVEVEQAGADSAERLLQGMGVAWEPAQLAPQAGEAGAARAPWTLMEASR
jgi:hypothetical protein